MTYPSFQQLCIALCDGIEAPRLEFRESTAPDVAIVMTVGDVEITLWDEASDAPGDVMLLVAFGPLPRDKSLDACRALMDLNSLMLWKPACVFGRDAATGDVVLRYAYPLKNASAFDLYACIRDLAGVAQDWREHHFLDPSGSSSIASLVAAFG